MSDPSSYAMPHVDEDDHNLIDTEQIQLFDALDDLSGLKTGFEIPQLIVVGDQSSGKSSTLEALVRFKFPVNSMFCTRFPIRLILRRSQTSLSVTNVSIEPGSGRSKQDEQAVTDALSKCPRDFGKCIAQATQILGLDSVKSVSNERANKKGGNRANHKGLHQRSRSGPNGAISTDDPSAPISSSTTETSTASAASEVLRFEKTGPDYGNISLLDLPGLIQAKTKEQSEETVNVIQQVVKDHASSERSLILLIINAQYSYANHYSLKLVQDLIKNDKTAANRVIGVVTNPDNARDLSWEALKLLSGNLGSDNFLYPWHVVRNQPQSERSQGLDKRDQREREFLNSDEQWDGITSIPKDQKGITSLRCTIKKALRDLTRAQLPDLITDVQGRIHGVQSLLKELGPSRSDPIECSRYLEDIAQVHSRLMEAACRGDYDSKACIANSEAGHMSQYCKACTFFPPLGDHDPDAQSKRLLANIRLLNQRFTIVMRKAGRTEMVVNTSSGMSREHQEQSTSLDDKVWEKTLPNWGTLQSYYDHGTPRESAPNSGEEDLAVRFIGWRGKEPPGEPSPGMFGAFFEYQSKNWEKIATNHHQAVWEVVKEFTDLALSASCPSYEICESLKKTIIWPELERLKEASAETLQALLACRGRGKTGFYDSFADLLVEQDKSTKRVISDLDALDTKIRLVRAEMGSDRDPIGREKFHIHFKDVLSATARIALQSSFNSTLSALPGLQVFIGEKVDEMFERAFAPDIEGAPAASRATENGVETLVNSKRILNHVEVVYRIVLQSFISFVNSLVIERGIIDRLPGAVFRCIKDLLRDDTEEAQLKIKEVTGEDEQVTAKREQYQSQLRKLERVLGILKKYCNN